MSLIPAKADRRPLGNFVFVMTALYLVVSSFLPPLACALNWAWVIAGVAFLVQTKVEPGLPRTFVGNVRRVLKAHAWPYFVARR
jgi:hypothetical protein